MSSIHACLACGKAMTKTAAGFECRVDGCGITKMDGHAAKIVENGDVVTVYIIRTVELSLSAESAEYIYLSLRADSYDYNPTADLALNDLRKSLRKSEGGRALLRKLEDSSGEEA